MNRSVLSLALLAAATAVAPAQLSAQCPANPLSALSGTWTFNVQALPIANVAFRDLNSYAVAGQFRASIGTDRAGNPTGLLAINATANLNGSTTRLENDAGSYQINSVCSGGTITMNLSSYPMQYDFWFANGGQTINLVSTIGGRSATGTAVMGATSCPAGLVEPLTLVNGAYAFKFQHLALTDFFFDQTYGIAGRMVASVGTDRANNPIGVLAITATSNFSTEHSVTRLEKDTGRYQINSDCSGGTLTFNLSSKPYQYQFYFRADFQEFYVINTSNAAIYGVVTRSNPAVGCGLRPLSLLSGPWTFNMQVISKDAADANWAVTGRWVASESTDRAGNPLGVLNINASSIQSSTRVGLVNATRLENDLGRYQLNEDCTGGTLTMNLSSFPMQYDFWFYDNLQKIYFVSTSPGRGATGSATKGVSGCPVGVTPLSLLSGTYNFKIQRIPNFTIEPYGIAGFFTAAIGADRAGNPQGQLAITATASIGAAGSIVRLERDIGRYQIEDDCTGGSLIFNLSSRPVQFQFYFREGFQDMDVISQVGPAAFGVVTR